MTVPMTALLFFKILFISFKVVNDPSIARNNYGQCHGSGSGNNRRVPGAASTMVKLTSLF